MKERYRPRLEGVSPSRPAPEAVTEPAPARAEPRVLADRYELLETLAHGGFAVTHRARDRTTGEDCVVKEVLYRKIEDPKTLELLEREARVLAHLRHPRIPRFVEFFSEQVEGETRLFLVQGYVPGRSLAQRAREGKHFSEREVIGIALQVARILSHLHELRPPIIHRDVKPGNVVLDPAGEAWLVDFGAVRDRILHEIRTEADSPTIVGTYGYMPFEQFQGRALPASDVYALGMTLVFLLTHKEPYEIEAVSGRLELQPHLHASRGLMRVVHRMLEPRPEDRYPSATELCADLEALLAPPARWLASAGRHLAALGIAAAALAGVVGFGLMRLSSPPVAPVAAGHLSAPVPVAPRPPAVGPARRPPPQVETLGYSVAGRLTFDGQPLETITDKPARFWLRHEGRGEAQPGTVSYQGGRFLVSALPQGRIGAQVTVDLNPSNPAIYPGDLYRWTILEVGAKREPLEIDLWKIIRLRSPQDNGAPLPGWGEDCPNMFLTDSARFEWEAPAEGIIYDYSLERVECPYVSHQEVLSGTTSATEVTLPLSPNAANDFYLFRLHAKRGDRTIALITTHGMKGGLGWDYRFRVR